MAHLSIPTLFSASGCVSAWTRSRTYLERVKRRKRTPCSHALKLRYVNDYSSTPLPRSLPWCSAGGCVSAWWSRSRACSWTCRERETEGHPMPWPKPSLLERLQLYTFASLPWCSASGCVSAWWSRSRACSWTGRERETQGHPMMWPKPSLRECMATA